MINDLMQTRPSIAETKINEIAEQFSPFKKEIDSLKQKMDETNKKPQNRNEPKQHALNKPESSYNGIRIKGLVELDSKNSRDRHEYYLEEVNKLFAFLTVEAKITDLKRLGKYEEGKRPRTVVVKVSNELQKRLILMSLAKLKNYDKTLFVSKELSPIEFLIENKLLRKKRTMIEIGVSAKNLRLRDLVLLKIKNFMPKRQKYFRHQQKNSFFKCSN